MHDACFILIENRDKTAPVCFFHASTSIDFFHQCEIDQTDRQTWEPDTFSFPSEPEKKHLWHSTESWLFERDP